MKVEDWPLAKIKAYPGNPRKRKKRAVEKVAASIKEFGFRQPIVVDEDGVILVGHTRRDAAQLLGLKKAPVHQAIGLSDAQKIAYRIADNRTNEETEWDLPLLDVEIKALSSLEFNLDLTGFEMREVSSYLRGGPQEGEDDVPEPEEAVTTQRGDLWILGDHRLLCGDSTNEADVSRLMGKERADCVFTSPPYAVGIEYGIYRDTIENLRVLLKSSSAMWLKVVRRGGYAVVNFGDIVTGRELAESSEVCEYPMALEHFPVFRSDGWALWARRIWCKPGASAGSSRHCIGTNRAASNFEHIWTWKAPGKSIVDFQTTGEHASQNGWFGSTHGVKLGVPLSEHGAGMPVMPARFGILNHSFEGGIVHEPFCGTGTTLIAAETEERRCFGIEIEPRYCDVIIRRWEKFTGKEACVGDGPYKGLVYSSAVDGRRREAEDAIAEEVMNATD